MVHFSLRVVKFTKASNRKREIITTAPTRKQKSQCSEANEATAKGTATKKKQTQVQEAVKCKKQRIAAERKKESCVGSKNSVTSVASDFIVKHASKGISLGWRLIYMLEREVDNK
ncbi:hypothetical protein ACLKA6_019768 [Drosophila palustris]